jgi:hypothetical protein
MKVSILRRASFVLEKTEIEGSSMKAEGFNTLLSQDESGRVGRAEKTMTSRKVGWQSGGMSGVVR